MDQDRNRQGGAGSQQSGDKHQGRQGHKSR
jgi:hypothetical protein